jgi:hypothetical protein
MSEEGASYKEQILDAARRNNSDLFEEILKQAGTGITHIINGSRDPLGNTPLHLAAKYGSYEVLDEILDQEGVEVDPVNRIDGDTPLHLAVRYAEEEPEHGAFIAETLIEAGADARIKNSNGLKPIQLVRSNASLTELLLGAELAFQLEQEERERGKLSMRFSMEHALTITGDEEIEDDEGSGSDSGSE